MAYTPCTAAEVAANLQENCNNPATEGLQVLGVAMAKADISAFVRGNTQATKNLVSSITLAGGKKTFVIEASGSTPWADSGEEFDAELRKWNKTANFVAPDYGAEIASNCIEPLCKNKDGFVVILQRKNTRGIGSFVIVGLEQGAVVTTGNRNDTDAATSGCPSLTLTETGAPSSEINFFDTDYATTKAAFDALVAASV